MKGVLAWLIVAVGVLSLHGQDAAANHAGFYRVAKIDNVWWFIRPDGKPFFSSGVNVIDPGPARDDYDPQRPAYAAFRYYPDTATWATKAQERLVQWGFNTVGGWSAPETMKDSLPYVEVLHVGGKLGAPFNDFLQPEYADRLDQWMREHVKPRADDTNVLGWCTDNEQSWFPDMLFRSHITQSPESKTRQLLVQLLEEHYERDFHRLEMDFQRSGVRSFDELKRGGELRFRPHAQGMKVAERFMGRLAEHYYQTMHEAIRRYDPNHLILGDRYHGYCPDVVAKAAAPYVDVLTTNFDRPGWTNGQLPLYYLERLHEMSDKPILVTEYYVAAQENRSGNKNTRNVFTTVATQHDRATALRNRFKLFASLPYVVGAHWFQYTDEPTHGRPKDGEDYNFGLVDIEDRPYEELTTAFTELHAELPMLHSTAAKVADAANDNPMSIPIACPTAIEGLGRWDTQQALIRGGRKGPRNADLLVSWNAEGLYLAVVGCQYVDPKAYADESPPAGTKLLEWRMAVDGSPMKLRVEFGVGDEISVSEAACDCRLWHHGIRYTVIAKLPAEKFGHKRLQSGDRLKINAVLTDRQLGTTMTWERELECGGPRATLRGSTSRLRETGAQKSYSLPARPVAGSASVSVLSGGIYSIEQEPEKR